MPNKDGYVEHIAHSVTSDTPGLFDTGAFTTGVHSFTAPQAPGTYGYHCRIHLSMRGTLIVSG